MARLPNSEVCVLGFLESVKRTFNIAGCEVAVAADDEVYSPMDRVTGNVLITGGQYEQSGDAIRFELKEFWTETRSTGKSTTTVTVYKVHETVTLCGPFSIEPRSEHGHAFDVALPRNARPSRRGSGWCLVVTLDIPGARDPKGTVKLEVEPPEEFLAIVQACDFELGFKEDERKRGWRAKTGATHFRLRPPRLLEPELDYLALDLSQDEGGGVSMVLTFDLQEKSLGDYFKAIFNRDRVRKTIQLTHEQIWLRENEVNTEAISKTIGQVMQEVIDARPR